MACCARDPPPKDNQADKLKSDKIDRKIKKDFINTSQVMKLLLLGPGESGKSTIYKQINGLFNNGYAEHERKRFAELIFNNLYLGMKILCQQSIKLAEIDIEEMKGFDTEIVTAEAKIAEKFLAENVDYHHDLTPHVVESLKALWNDPGIRETWKRRAEFQIPYPIDYFMNRIDELVKNDYIPTQEDILRCRVRTTGIVELEFAIEQNKFVVIDVGGQRNERKKWMHCFDKVTAVIFVAAISEYDQFLYEDSSINRLQEALDLFSEISQMKVFSNTHIILFLNKYDLFLDKIKTVPLTATFSDYFGSQEAGPASQFIQDKFLASTKSTKKNIFQHFTCATDSDMMRKVLLNTRDIIISKAFHNNDEILQ
jgi:GTPase SAR1 family protein